VYDLIADLRFAVRMLRTQPLFTIVAVLTLAVGIGANTALFTVINTLLLQPLPARDPDRLVSVYTTSLNIEHSTSSLPDWHDLRRMSTTLEDLAGYSGMFVNVTREGRAELLTGEIVTDNYFDLLGIPMALGREFTPAENEAPGAHPVAVLGYDYWQEEFAGSPDVAGQTLTLNGTPFTIIGVAPPEFRGRFPSVRAAMWIPTMMAEVVDPGGLIDTVPSPGETRMERRGNRWLFMVGRMAEGVAIESVRAELGTIMGVLAEDYPGSNEGREARVLPAGSVRIHPALDPVVSGASAILLGLVGLVLLVACANVAGMLLARAAGRRREIAVRLALGAGPRRIMRQLLTESLLLAVLGGAAGLLMAVWLVQLLAVLQPPQLTVSIDMALVMDGRVFLFALLATAVSGIVFGLAPALQTARLDLTPYLKEMSALGSRPGRGGRLRTVLVVGQLAVSTLLLVAAGLMAVSLANARDVDPGVDLDRVAVFSTSLEMIGYDAEGAKQLFEHLREILISRPDVEAVSVTARAPLSFNIWSRDLYLEGHQQSPEDDPYLEDITIADEDYFETVGVPILNGRSFRRSDTEDTPGVVVVSSAFARRYWPGESAVGKTIWNDGLTGTSYEVIGICADYKVRSVTEAPRPMVHYCRSQYPTRAGTIMVRVRGEAAPLVDRLATDIREVEPAISFFEVGTIRDSARFSLSPIQTGTGLIGGLGLLALLLAAVGLYGIIAYSTGQQHREIGIRIALGSSKGGIVRHVVGRGLLLAFIGGAIGLLGAALSARLLSGVLFEVGALHLPVYALALLVLFVIAGLANAVPALRAARVDPVITLRDE